MNLKKALIPLALTALLTLAAAPALAAEINQDTAQSKGVTNVTASVDTTYTITIPDSDTLKFEKLTGTAEEAARTKTFNVSAKGVTLEPGKQLNVTVSGENNDFKMTNAALSSVKLPYTITPAAGSALRPGGTIASFANNSTETVSSTLIVNAPTMGAGNYSDTLTFTCTVEGP